MVCPRAIRFLRGYCDETKPRVECLEMGFRRLLRVEPAESEGSRSAGQQKQKETRQDATAESPHPPPGIRGFVCLSKNAAFGGVCGGSKPPILSSPPVPADPSKGRPSRSCAVKLSLPRLLPRQPNRRAKAQVRHSSQLPRFNDGRLPSPPPRDPPRPTVPDAPSRRGVVPIRRAGLAV